MNNYTFAVLFVEQLNPKNLMKSKIYRALDGIGYTGVYDITLC